ncbi:sulfite exporter TauE/SafE family protein [Paenibacillus piri]|uniref:Sulfite exporter TauE/SafE family protein n=2 Tax=Paenibacillus piri TaxID=2547395 RepID=A0A4R5KPT8_9BACL|nr:sulfite exporter TauE/SafE family protein [Paenibacillus piri]TDF97739.1 sulfite exporter TauE/SafE family protein [Paenibacillus piri]
MTGILGAPHCIGMCGGTVSGFALNAENGMVRTVAAYNLGRITTYTGLGALMGAAGSFVETAGRLAGLQGIASIIGGIFILLWVFRKVALPLARWGPLGIPYFRGLSQKLKSSRETGAVYGSGLLLGFIPCGLTYAMQMNAAASSEAWSGALIMAVFGIATLPALFFAGLFAGSIKKSLRGKVLWAGQAVAVWIGILSILRGMAANSWLPSVHPWLW